MDNSVMGGGILSSPSAGILDLEPSIGRHQLSHRTLDQHNMRAMGPLSGMDGDHPVAAASKAFVVNTNKGKGISSTATVTNNNTSDEEDPSFTEDGNDAQHIGVKGKKSSPWQRMKWTDSMVRLLITVVACVGEDVTPDSADGPKRKSGVLQKKGKWKTISKLMLERGCFVSPQQCEDKFNDLNKRYKRLNEILGKGTTCRVVENPVLLDSMIHLSPKIKEDVKKILSSKHLFYKEMCAFHNGQRIPNGQELDLPGCSLPISMSSKEANGFEQDEEDNEDDDYLDNDDEVNGDEDVRISNFQRRDGVTEQDSHFWSQSGGFDSFGAEIAGMLKDPSKSPGQQKEWIRNWCLQLQEQRVNFQAQAFELEKRRFKWQRFCSKKDRELERLRLENDRMRLENERMVLQVKQKELEIDSQSCEDSFKLVSTGIDT
ncbi:uncharacterized protein [Aristolochia californica]|uniref:uncharacterized protein n=1 Tax=Aristolochia californica TaxID=171875 RepID=UPI0035DA87EE